MESRQIYNRAIALLARREHSETELRSKLCKAFGGQEPLVQRLVQEVVERLRHDGYLSDLRYATCYIRSRANRGFGVERIAQELTAKGVNAEVCEAALDHAGESGICWPEVIEQVWRKKFGKAPENFQEKCRQIRFLQYRGFPAEQIATLEGIWKAETRAGTSTGTGK